MLSGCSTSNKEFSDAKELTQYLEDYKNKLSNKEPFDVDEYCEKVSIAEHFDNCVTQTNKNVELVATYPDSDRIYKSNSKSVTLVELETFKVEYEDIYIIRGFNFYEYGNYDEFYIAITIIEDLHDLENPSEYTTYYFLLEKDGLYYRYFSPPR